MQGFWAGLALGFGSGVAPGPLFALVVSTSLQRGLAAGAQVAASPLVTDLPVIVLSLTVLSAVPAVVLPVLALVGAGVLVWFAVESFRDARTATLAVAAPSAGSRSLAPLRRGALVNILNPAPWLFWITIGGPMLVSGWRSQPSAAVLWLLGFYLALVGSKVALAATVSLGRHRLSTRGYRRLLVVAGVLLLAMAAVMLHEALGALNASG